MTQDNEEPGLLAALQHNPGSRRVLRAQMVQAWSEVSGALEAGYSIVDVFRELVAAGKWCGCYDTFRRYCHHFGSGNGVRKPGTRPSLSANTTAPPRPRPTHSNPMLERREKPGFNYDKTMSEEVKHLIEPVGDDE